MIAKPLSAAAAFMLSAQRIQNINKDKDKTHAKNSGSNHPRK